MATLPVQCAAKANKVAPACKSSFVSSVIKPLRINLWNSLSQDAIKEIFMEEEKGVLNGYDVKYVELPYSGAVYLGISSLGYLHI